MSRIFHLPPAVTLPSFRPAKMRGLPPFGLSKVPGPAKAEGIKASEGGAHSRQGAVGLAHGGSGRVRRGEVLSVRCIRFKGRGN